MPGADTDTRRARAGRLHTTPTNDARCLRTTAAELRRPTDAARGEHRSIA